MPEHIYNSHNSNRESNQYEKEQKYYHSNFGTIIFPKMLDIWKPLNSIMTTLFYDLTRDSIANKFLL